MPKILIGLPTYDSRTDTRQALFLYGARVDNLQTVARTRQLSALCWCFNHLWADALNDRTFDYFLLIHADIIPTAPVRWISKMINEADRCGADLLSVVAPLKTKTGLTSTGLVTDQHPTERRMSLHEAHKLPETFDADKLAEAFGYADDTGKILLANTGLMLCDLRRKRDKWEQVYFKTVDRVEKRDRKFVATFTPEDWDFSKQVHALGMKTVCTRAVSLIHHGAADYSNDSAWGEWETDKAQ